MKEILWDLKYRKSKIKENAWMWLVWKLPRTLIMWSTIRLVSHATTGEYGNTIVPELSAMDAIQRWNENQEG